VIYFLGAAYIVLGVFVAALAYRIPKRPSTKVLVASFVSALFFSASIISWRIVVLPFPTLIVIVLWMADVIAEQFGPGYDSKPATVYFVLPFLIQWTVWWGIFMIIPILRLRWQRSIVK
jgi:hypothetical protein